MTVYPPFHLAQSKQNGKKAMATIRQIVLIFGLWSVCLSQSFAGIAQSDTAEIKRLLAQATALQRIDLDSCETLSKKALFLAQKLKYSSGIRGAYVRLGSVLMTRGENESARAYIATALQIDIKTANYKGAAGNCVLLAYIFDALGASDSAFMVLYEGLRYSDRTNDPEIKALVYNTLGDIQEGYAQYEASLKSLQKALEYASKTPNSAYLSGIYISLGNGNYHLGNYREALKYYTLADSLCRAQNDQMSVAQNLNNLALVYAALYQSPRAIAYYAEALQLYRTLDMPTEVANVYANLGELYLDINQIQLARLHFDTALAQNRQLGLAQEVLANLHQLAGTHARLKAFEPAYQYRTQAAELADSLLTAEKISSISEVQTKYESEKKEQQIAALEADKLVKQRQRNLTLLGLVVLLVIAVVLYVQRRRIREERNRANALLLNILPTEVANELKATGASEARLYNNVTVLFTDFVNFTGISEKLSPTDLVAEIHKNFTAFDAIIEKYGLEKIKTIGDAYLAVCGLPHETVNHAEKVVLAALEICAFIQQSNSPFQVRIGINSGPVVAGIVGVKKYAYDIWGDTVNTAARMEQHSEAGKINISGSTYELVKANCLCTPRGKIKAKNKGEIEMYFVEQDNSKLI